VSIGALPDALAHFDAVHVGQHQVEDDECRLLRGDELQRLRPVRRRANRVAGVLQIGGDERRDRRLVFDDEHRLRLRGHVALTPPGPS
jgi:hypothetical protein